MTMLESHFDRVDYRGLMNTRDVGRELLARTIEFPEIIPQEVVDRAIYDAYCLASGESDPKLRATVYDSACRLLRSRLIESRSF